MPSASAIHRDRFAFARDVLKKIDYQIDQKSTLRLENIEKRLDSVVTIWDLAYDIYLAVPPEQRNNFVKSPKYPTALWELLERGIVASVNHPHFKINKKSNVNAESIKDGVRMFMDNVGDVVDEANVRDKAALVFENVHNLALARAFKEATEQGNREVLEVLGFFDTPYMREALQRVYQTFIVVKNASAETFARRFAELALVDAMRG